MHDACIKAARLVGFTSIQAPALRPELPSSVQSPPKLHLGTAVLLHTMQGLQTVPILAHALQLSPCTEPCAAQ
jgi:hypothetical protein